MGPPSGPQSVLHRRQLETSAHRSSLSTLVGRCFAKPFGLFWNAPSLSDFAVFKMLFK